jgi:pyruvate decarboxylase
MPLVWPAGTYWGPVSSTGAGETVESADLYIFVGPRFNDYNTTGYSCLIKVRRPRTHTP